MGTLSVTVAIDQSNLFERMKASFEALNALPIIRLDAWADSLCLAHPDRAPWIKAHLWDIADAIDVRVDRICWIDADVLCFAPMGGLSDAPFAACLDTSVAWEREREFPHFVNLPRYFNTGFFTTTRACRGVFERLKERQKTAGPAQSGTIEESWFNLSLLEERVGFEVLQEKYNVIFRSERLAPDDVVHVHYAGFSNAEKERWQALHASEGVRTAGGRIVMAGSGLAGS